MSDRPDPVADNPLLADVLAGLGQPQKAVPARWLYDHHGSELFEAITDLPEYYPTRTETAILKEAGPAVAVHASGRVVVEFGSGSSAKTPLLLSVVNPAAYVPIDISGDFLRESSAVLAARFPGLAVLPVEADFLRAVPMPAAVAGQPRLGFFPGSTIGNMVPRAAVDLLRSMRTTLGADGMLLIGFDRIKSPEVLVPAYDDAAGVTARFNRNLLSRINRECGADIPVDAFRHQARWNAALARIEMHLEATRAVAFTIADRPFTLAAGETIHTENSHKYGERDAAVLLLAGGWTPVESWSDADGWFSIILAAATTYRMAP